MAAQRKAPGWQRAISAALVVAGIWAFSRPALYDNVEFPGSLLSLALALSGLYLFGYFAIRGRLPKGLAPDASSGSDRRDSDV